MLLKHPWHHLYYASDNSFPVLIISITALSITPCMALAHGSSLHHQSVITPLLCQLYWLEVPWRIDYKLAVLVYKCFHGLAPSYLADELHHPAESEFRGICVPLRLMNYLFAVPDSHPRATEHFQSLLYGSGTVFCCISHLLHHFLSSALI